MHVKGAFKVTKSAWEHMKKNNFGRIIFTSSAAGLYGNYGQTNYSSAKSSLIGFSHSLALEGKKFNIHSNTIAPIASSRILATINQTDKLKPEYISPLVLYLCHEDCKETGGLFECGAGWYTKLNYFRTKGVHLKGEIQPEDIQKNWNLITDFKEPVQVKSAVDSIKHTSELLSKL